MNGLCSTPAAVAVAFLASAAQAACLKYEPTRVRLTGTIASKVDFGPPGYGEDPKRDSREGHLYFNLDHSVCVVAAPNDLDNETERNVKVMQMVYYDRYPFQRTWLGKHVSVEGTLFHGHTGHHWTAVLIQPEETHLLTHEVPR